MRTDHVDTNHDATHAFPQLSRLRLSLFPKARESGGEILSLVVDMQLFPISGEKRFRLIKPLSSDNTRKMPKPFRCADLFLREKDSGTCGY